jgi:hypothetical protein
MNKNLRQLKDDAAPTVQGVELIVIMVSPAFFFVFVLWYVHIVALSVEIPSCDGVWVQHDGPKSHRFLGLNRTFEEYGSNYSKILLEMCPTETFYYNCFYHGAGDRASSLLNREWLSHDARCEQFDPLKFFEKLRNRNLYMLGDSVMGQNWNALICRLLDSIPVTDIIIYSIHWLQYQGGTLELTKAYNENTCPVGASHCLLGYESIIHLRKFNVTIVYRRSAMDLHIGLVDAIKIYPISDNDVIIANNGLHYSDPVWYRDIIQKLYHVLASIKPANFYFMESTPQHFASVRLFVPTCDKNPSSFFKSAEHVLLISLDYWIT